MDWEQHFTDEAARRARRGDPDWAAGAALPDPVARSVAKFQVGESGDGANLIAKATGSGDREYAAAVRLFVAEEQNHARMLARLLTAAGRPTIGWHWSDALFVRLRRALGLRLELLVLMVAEVVALSYYRALRDGTGDALTTQVAGRILADEQRHVPFHCDRLRQELAGLPSGVRWLVTSAWRVLVTGAAVLVAIDHGPALHALGVHRRGFVIDVVRQTGSAARAMRGSERRRLAAQGWE